VPAMNAGDDSDLRETATGRSEIYRGRLLTLYEDTISAADGTPGRREVVTHPGAVAVVATVPDGRVVVVRQWRHPLGQALWEIPAGLLEPDEPPLLAAQRELREETGYTAAGWRLLGVLATAPGFCSERLTLFAADGLTPGEPDLDEGEIVRAALMTPDELLLLAAAGETDAKTVAALALAALPPRA
jgi:ADP-ribose pyrophosphatase